MLQEAMVEATTALRSMTQTLLIVCTEEVRCVQVNVEGVGTEYL